MKFNIFLLCLLCLFGTGCSESREDKYIRLNTELVRLEAQKKSLGLEIEEFLYPDGELLGIDPGDSMKTEFWLTAREKQESIMERKLVARAKIVERRKTDPYYKTRQSKMDDLDAQINEVKIIIIAMEKT